MNMNLRQILLVLRLRWWVIVGVLVVVFGAAVAVTLTMPKLYSAETSILLDVKSDPLLATLMPSLASASYISTQVEIIRSDRVSGRVVKMLGLAQNPAAVAQWREATEGRVPLETYFGNQMQRGMVVEPVRGSALMTVAYTGTDPKFAAAAANTFARAYIDLSVELRVGPAREYATFFDERMKSLRDDLEAAQARLSAFQQKRGIVVTSERMDQEMSRLNSLEAALASALAESADTSSRQRNAGTDTSVDVQQSGAVQSLRAALSTAETRQSELSATYGSNHPLRIEIDTRIAELKQQIAAEMRRVSGTTTTVNRIASQRVGELRSMVDGQKRTVLNLRTQRDEAGGLLREVETAQRAFDTVAQRRTQLANESQAEQAQARVLSPATEPLTHSKPNIQKNLTAGAMLGLLAGLGVAFLLELIDRRVRSAQDLFNSDANVPVLAVMSARTGKRGFSPRLAFDRRRGPPMPPQLTLDRGVQ
jgi:chain length determinant protein EpsF